jgi:hypothetical protein
MKLFAAALVSAISLPSMALAAAMAGSTEWVIFYDMTSGKNPVGTALQAKSIIEKAGGEIRCAYGKCPATYCPAV